MALFINGVGQDTFNMNGVSIDNLYVDGVLVWSSYVNTKPVISIIGDNPMYLVLNGSAYVEQGATALDTEDGDITNDIVIGGDTPDVSIEGYYYVTYNVTDSDGLAADEQVRTVSVYVVTVPKYELTEELINDGTFDYVPDSNNPESSFTGKLTESDGTTPYLPTELQYPQNGLLELDNGRIMNTQFDIDVIYDDYGLYGIYDADGSTEYKIWAVNITGSGVGELYEGDQDTPLALYGFIDVNGLTGTYTVTDGRPSWLPSLDPVYGPELIVGGGNDNGVLDSTQWTKIPGNAYNAENKTKLTESCINYYADTQYSGHYQAFTTEIGETYEVNVRIAGDGAVNGDPTSSFTRVSTIDSIPSIGEGGELITSGSLSWENKTADYVATSTTSYFVVKNSGAYEGGNLAMISVKKRTA